MNRHHHREKPISFALTPLMGLFVGTFGGLSGACVNTLSDVEHIEKEAAFAEEPSEISSAEGDEGFVDFFILPSTDAPSEEESQMMIQHSQQMRRIVFMNKSGGTFQPGQNNSSTNRSSIIGGVASVDAYEGTAANWSTVLQCVRDQFSDWDIEITDVNPGNVAHIEMVMGGRPGQLGMGNGVWGVAPMFGDCSTVERAIGFTFTKSIPTLQDECETAAHEIGHALGLDHEYLCEDPMTYLSGCGAKSFQDEASWCGEYSARQCSCGGQQNTVAHLASRLGARIDDAPPFDDDNAPDDSLPDGDADATDTTAPTVTVLSPTSGASITGDGFITVEAQIIDDNAATAVLKWTFGKTLFTMDCANPPSVASCTRTGDIARWTIRVGTGARSFHVESRDSSNNFSSTPEQMLTLVAASPPPGPVGDVVSPVVGEVIVPGSHFDVDVIATSSVAINRVDLWWILPSGNATHYLLQNRGDDHFGLGLDLSSSAQAGTRALRIRVTDQNGAQKVLPDVVVNVVP